MPWRGPAYAGEYPSLGWQVLDWMEDMLVVPDGAFAGQPIRFTDEQASFIVRLYRINTRTRKLFYRRAQLVRPKGWGKSPVEACNVWAEAKGPVRFDGWDANGEPVGRPVPTPWIQIAATAEDQTANTWEALVGTVADAPVLSHYPDIDLGISGRTRILLANQGKIEPVTSRAGTRIGQRVTFAVLDETHLWRKDNGGLELARKIRDNTTKMSGLSVETTNAWRPGLGSVAERTFAASQTQRDILCDFTEGEDVDLADRKEVLRNLKHVYGDSHRFVDFSRLFDEGVDPDTDPSEHKRFFHNVLSSSTSDLFFDPDKFHERAAERTVRKGTPVTLGFHGRRPERGIDHAALYACTNDGHLFALGVWAQPTNPTYEVPAGDIDAAVDRAFDQYQVARLYADPRDFRDYIDRWGERYGTKRVLRWRIDRPTSWSAALERLRTALRTGEEVTHDAHPQLAEHVENSLTSTVRGKDIIVKEHDASRKLITTAVAAALAYEARGDAIKAGEMTPKRTYRTQGF